MITLNDVLDALYDADGDEPIRVEFRSCPECSCIHISDDEEKLCALCESFETTGELSEYVRDRLSVAIRMRKDGTHEPPHE